MLVPATDEDKEEFLIEKRHQSKIVEAHISSNSINLGERRASHYEQIIHPNEEKEDDDDDDSGPKVGWVNSGFVKWFARFDEEKLRPFFIRKYNAAKIVLEDEY